MKTEKFDIDVQDCWRAAMAHINAKRNEANKIRADWSQPSHVPSEAEIKTAALLAWEGRLTSVEWIYIDNINITDIPHQLSHGELALITCLMLYSYAASWPVSSVHCYGWRIWN